MLIKVTLFVLWLVIDFFLGMAMGYLLMWKFHLSVWLAAIITALVTFAIGYEIAHILF